MKFNKKILKSLVEGAYKVKITDFYFMSTKDKSAKRLVLENIDEDIIQRIADKKEGYFQIDLEVTDPEGVIRNDTMQVWPARFWWTMEQLANKVDSELEGTDDLIGKEVELYYSHKYLDKNEHIVQRKQWNLYENIIPDTTANVPEDDEAF